MCFRLQQMRPKYSGHVKYQIPMPTQPKINTWNQDVCLLKTWRENCVYRDALTEKMFVYKTHDAGSSTWAPHPTPKTCTSQMYETVSVQLKVTRSFLLGWWDGLAGKKKNEFTAKPDNPSLILRTQKVEEENGLPQVVLWPPCSL